MRKSSKRIIIIGIVLVLGIASALIGVRSYVFSITKKHIDKRLSALDQRGIQIRYDSISLDWRRNLILFEKVVISMNTYDTTCLHPEFIAANQLRLEGFGLLSFLLTNKIDFETVILNEPHILLKQNSAFLPDSVSRESRLDLTINDLRLISARIEYTDSLACQLLSGVTTDFYAMNNSLALGPGKDPKFSTDIIRLQNMNIDLPEVFYNLTIKNVNVDVGESQMVLDTLMINPLLTKLEFGRTIGREIDRVEGVIPFLKLKNFNFSLDDSLSFTVAKTEIQGFVKFFRDKSLPLKKVFKPLPPDLLRRLPFGLTIDTFEVVKSFIEYEEFPEEGTQSGKVFFDDLRGNISNLTNLPNDDGEIKINASARFMGASELSMNTVFPLNPKRRAVTSGALTNLDLTKLNPMLESMANINVESGDLERLAFKLIYDPTRADGEVELTYHNLKLISFKDEEKVRKQEGKRKNKNKTTDELKKDNFKTFILNTFVIKRNMNDKLPDEKRKGTVLFYRDTNRSIFNYWWSAAFSGIKSAYNIDGNKSDKQE